MTRSSSADQNGAICFVGVMTGHLPNSVTSQGEILAELFAAEGHEVMVVSRRRFRLTKLTDIAARLVRDRRRINVVWLGVYGGLSFVLEDFASLIGVRLGLPIVMHLHGGALPVFIRRHPRWARRVLSRATVIVAPSPYLARAVTQLGFDCSVIPNVVEQDRYRYRERAALQPRLFWMRSFHPIWNPLMALRTLVRVREVYPDATLAMAGQDKGQLTEVKTRATELGISDAVTFVGFLDHEGKQTHGDHAQIFLNTNRIDNTPVSVIEAAAMGIPIVSTNVGGVPDLVTHQWDALLVEDDDDAAMAEAVFRLLREPDLARKLSHNGRELSTRSDWRNVFPMWCDVLATCSGAATRHSLDRLRTR